MSSLTLVELNLLAGLLIEMLVTPPKRVDEAEQAKCRAEEMRIAELERRQEEENRQQIRRLEQQRRMYQNAAIKERDEALLAQNRMLSTLKGTVQQILSEVDSAGSDFLGDYANLVFNRDLYTRLIEGREAVREAANAILSEARIVQPGDAEGRIADLEERVSQLKTSWKSLLDSCAEAADNEAERDKQNAQFAQWLTALDAGLDTMREKIEIFPDMPEDDASAHAQAVDTALKTIEYYIYSADSFFLMPEQKAEVAHLYGVPMEGDGFNGLPPWVEEDIELRNQRFASSRRRALDRQIYTTRNDLEQAQMAYLRMRETLSLTDEGIDWDAYADANTLLAELQRQIKSMTGRVQKRAQRQIVESVIDRALRSAKRGMSVRMLGDEETRTGSWRGLYQIGEAGTTLEVFADARGNVSIEAGAILEDGSEKPTAAQADAIVRNNRYFCSSELPMIVESIQEELEASGQDGSVKVTETQGPEGVHVFNISRYRNPGKGAFVLKTDGTAAMDGVQSAGTSDNKAMYLEDES